MGGGILNRQTCFNILMEAVQPMRIARTSLLLFGGHMLGCQCFWGIVFFFFIMFKKIKCKVKCNVLPTFSQQRSRDLVYSSNVDIESHWLLWESSGHALWPMQRSVCRYREEGSGVSDGPCVYCFLLYIFPCSRPDHNDGIVVVGAPENSSFVSNKLIDSTLIIRASLYSGE